MYFEKQEFLMGLVFIIKIHEILEFKIKTSNFDSYLF